VLGGRLAGSRAGGLCCEERGRGLALLLLLLLVVVL
jgi:hypothetical protein